jgi:hypothetical protein
MADFKLTPTVNGTAVSLTGHTHTLADDSVTNAKLADMAEATVKGRAAGAGTGDPTDLTASQLAAIVQGAVDHAALDNLDYASAGHTEFAGTEVANTFLETQSFQGAIPIQVNLTGGSPAFWIKPIGDDGIAIGSDAGGSVSGANDNIAIGRDALGSNVSGINNIAVGAGTMGAATTAEDNVAIGTNALSSSTNGYDNFALGRGSLRDNQDGAQNVAIGAEALRDSVNGSNNIAIGATAGLGATGDSGIFIGEGSGSTETNSNRLHIGNNATLPLIYGVMNSLAANQLIQFNAATVILPNLPTADPSVSGALWNDAGTVVLSGQNAAERAQDAVGTILVDSATIDFTYNDGTPSITAIVIDDSITDGKLRNSGALSVIGRSANSAGDPADISATPASDAVLRESGSVIGWGTVATAGIANDAITYAKIQNVSATDRLLGRDTAAAGDIEEISLGASLEFSGSGSIQRAALTGDVTAAANGNVTTIANDVVTNAKLADMAEATIKGRAAAAGTGDPTDLTAAQVATIVQASVDHGSLAGLADDDHTQYLLVAGTRALTGEWDIGEDMSIRAERFEARDVEGLRIEDDGGNLGLFVEDGGFVGVGTAAPDAQLHISGSGEILRLADTSATGTPFISFYQTTTRRSYIGHSDPNDDLAITSEYGTISFWTGTGGTEVLRATFGNDGHLTFEDALRIQIDEVRARDSGGLFLRDDSGTTGIFVEDGGQVGIANTAPGYPLHVGAGADTLVRTDTAIAAQVAGAVAITARNSSADVEATMIAGGATAVFGSATNHELGFLVNNAQVAAISTGGVFSIKAGTSSGTEARVGGVLYVVTSQIGNVTTGEDDLASYTVPASTLATDDDSLWFEAALTVTNNANAKTLRVRFGTTGTNLVFTLALTTNTANTMQLRGRIYRDGAALQRSICSMIAATQNQSQSVTGLDQTLSGTVVLKVTGEGVSNNDIVINSFIVGWSPANT